MQKILNLIDEYRISEAFAELDKLGIKNPQFARLKQEFIFGNTNFDFADRLKAFVQSLPQETVIANNPNPNSPAKLKELLAKDKVEQVIQQLMEQTQGTDNQNVIIMQAARWKSLQNDLNLGIISHQDAQVQKNRLVSALLAILDDLEA